MAEYALMSVVKGSAMGRHFQAVSVGSVKAMIVQRWERSLETSVIEL